MEFNKLSAPSLKELFIHELETMILSGKLPIGEKLPPERTLSESMHVSRAVVNGGITELARKGFLSIKPRVGTFVADYRKNGTLETLVSIMNYNGGILRKAEIRSILELRIALDSLAIKLLIPNLTENDLTILREFVKEIEQAQKPEEAAVAAYHFQHELAFLSGNTLIPLIFSSFQKPVLTLWERFCRLYGIEALYMNTLTLFQYIEQRDIEAALNWITSSIEETIGGDRQIYFP